MVFLGQPLNDHEHLERCLLSFKQQGVAGVIYLASDTRASSLPEHIRQCPLPLVVVSQSLLDEKCNLVMRDNRRGEPCRALSYRARTPQHCLHWGS